MVGSAYELIVVISLCCQLLFPNLRRSYEDHRRFFKERITLPPIGITACQTFHAFQPARRSRLAAIAYNEFSPYANMKMCRFTVICKNGVTNDRFLRPYATPTYLPMNSGAGKRRKIVNVTAHCAANEKCTEF
jgi:hypothetical protein